MWRVMVSPVVVLMVMVCCGCEPTGAQRDTDFELRRVERERDTLQMKLASEEARGTVLARRIEDEEKEWQTAKAETATLKSRLRECERNYGTLQKEIARYVEEPPERPQIAASPLPDDVDQAFLSLVDRHSGRVWYERGRGAVSFANDRLFEMGSDTVRTDALGVVQDLAGILSLVPADHEIIIVGHSDNAPITKPETLAVHPSNWHLSVHRAIAIKDVLTNAGVPAKRMGVMGYGPYRPVSEDRAQNRRVEVFIVRQGAIQAFHPVRSSGAR